MEIKNKTQLEDVKQIRSALSGMAKEIECGHIAMPEAYKDAPDILRRVMSSCTELIGEYEARHDISVSISSADLKQAPAMRDCLNAVADAIEKGSTSLSGEYAGRREETVSHFRKAVHLYDALLDELRGNGEITEKICFSPENVTEAEETSRFLSGLAEDFEEDRVDILGSYGRYNKKMIAALWNAFSLFSAMMVDYCHNYGAEETDKKPGNGFANDNLF